MTLVILVLQHYKQHIQCDQCLLVKWSWTEPGTCNARYRKYGKGSKWVEICELEMQGTVRMGKEDASEMHETSLRMCVCQCNVFQWASIYFDFQDASNASS